MKRRDSLKAIAASALASGALIAGCKAPDAKSKDAVTDTPSPEGGFKLDRYPQELAYEETVKKQDAFFNKQEMATIGILADIIIPKDEVSGSATDAKVPDFIEFIVKDNPNFKTPMRGGLRWLDMYCLKKFEKSFKDITPEQRIEVVDLIAYPERGKDRPDLTQGISFFTLMRNLTATGFYTSEIGVKDCGYVGNQPNQWNGVPDEVLKQYGLAYSEKELKECISFTAV